MRSKLDDWLLYAVNRLMLYLSEEERLAVFISSFGLAIEFLLLLLFLYPFLDS